MRYLLAVGVRGRCLTDGKRLAPAARRPTGGQARLALLAAVACVAMLALGPASAQAQPARSGSFAASAGAADPASIDSESAANVLPTTAELQTQINPSGTDTTCQFQYVDDTDFMATGFTGPNVVTVNCSPQDLGSGNSDVTALAQIIGLTPSTTYDFRAVASPGPVDGSPAQFTTPPPASIDAESASNVGAQSAELDAQINPEGTDTTCQFQYVDDTDFQATGFTGPKVLTVPCNPTDLGSGTTDVSASAQISGLQLSTTYDFRAVATNSLAPSGVDGAATQFTTTAPVTIDSESATNVTDTTATLNAEVNPNGLDTKYQFQYVSDAQFDPNFTNATTVPAAPVDIGSGLTDQHATVDLTGLQPGTKYHFRVVATNSAGTVDGTDQTFTTYSSAQPTGIPDHRAYEMVTPANKDNGEPYLRAGSLLGPITSSTTGTALTWFSLNALPGSLFDGAFYTSNRGSSSWISTNLIPPQGPETSLLCATIAPEAVGYSQDMTKTVLADGGNQPFCSPDSPPLVAGEPTGAQNLFVRNADGTTFQLVDRTPMFGDPPADATFDGASTDLSTVVFDENARLTNNAPGATGSPSDDLYASSPSNSSSPNVQLVTVLPDGTPVVGSLADGTAGDAFGAVSSDGSTIFFTATPSSTTNLYARQNPTNPSTAKTVQVDSGIGGGGNFLAATPDGSKVFFSDSSGGNLYEYDLTTGHLTNLTPGGSAGIDGLAGISGDGSALYFVASGALPSKSDPEATPSTPVSGQPNLYVIPNGDASQTKFIATLNGSDVNDWSPGSLSARVSSNGSHVAFTSVNPLTGYTANNGAPEIFVYDSAAGSPTLNCASCSPGGGSAVAGASINAPFRPIDFANGEFLQRYVSDSGQVFFDTPDSLLPTDTNHTVSDVYEWEANGTGSCTSTVDNGGCLYLLTKGTSLSPSFFADASPNGSDVFFVTDDQLVPQDTDLAADFYDLRVGGGFPATAPPPSCQGEGCKPPESATPPVPVVASVTFFGPGNVKPSKPSKSSKKHEKHKKHKKSVRVATLAQRVAGDRIRILVTVPARGKISVSGTSLTGSSRIVRGAGAYTLTARLRPRAMTALETKHKLKLAITVRYVRAAGSASAATIELTVKA
jgi:ribosomal protein S18